jgi:hypothetical protein
MGGFYAEGVNHEGTKNTEEGGEVATDFTDVADQS